MASPCSDWSTPNRSLDRSPDAAVAGALLARQPPPTLFPPSTQPDTPSASLVSSTAQERPISLSDVGAADRTTALRELTRSQNTAGPPNTTSATTSTTAGTYSHPVLVRTYSGPTPSSARRDAIAGSGSGSGGKPAPPPSVGRHGRRGFAITLARPVARYKPSHGEDAKLPPLEDFTFKSILAEIEHDIGADLDRIADICARSRYSLSNQYEIHVAPHGSGHKFGHATLSSASTARPMPGGGGPTLQAVSIEDDRAISATQSRRIAVRRRSVAYGTLETIISSSRSSDEDRGGKRKSATEIAAQVRAQPRGRIQPPGSEPVGRARQETRARPTLAATILDRSRAQAHRRPGPPSRHSDSALVGEPAIPETSGGHLVSTTAPEGVTCGDINIRPPAKELSSVSVSRSVAAAAIAIPEDPKEQPGMFSGLRLSIPWTSSPSPDDIPAVQKPGRTKSYAEGILRELLKIAELGNREAKTPGRRNRLPG